jgi:hypothetical protein
MKNALDWAMDLLTRVHLPPDMSASEFQERMQELRIMKQQGLTNNSLFCPRDGCSYAVTAPPGMVLDDSPVCIHHGVTLVAMTWKQMAEKSFLALKNQEAQFGQKVENAKAMVETSMELSRDLQDRLDRQNFEEIELEQLRQITSGPTGRFAKLMDRELQENAHKGNWEDWKPTSQELLSEVTHHLDKLKFVLARFNRPAVTEFSADIANFMQKTHEMYGQPQ